ncbi:MAG: sugar phosphate isomerase/epimerase family protein [Gaiellales bacterium]
MQLGLVTEAFAGRPLSELLDWLGRHAPGVRALEVGAGGYAPTTHCDPAALLADAGLRERYVGELERRGIHLAALNTWGNPLHPDADVAGRHDRDLRTAIRAAAQLGVNRVVALAGAPAVAEGDRAPVFSAGGWLPYLEGAWESQWERAAGPYWSGLSEFARAEHPDLLVCIELHPGTCVYNVETFAHLASLGPNLAANVDPSHFMWMHMDPLSVVAALPLIGHAHAKDVRFNPGRLALQGLLDHRWSGEDADAPWAFTTVGRGHDSGWWHRFWTALADRGVPACCIEHEDPAVAPEPGVVEAAELLSAAAAPAPAV